MSGGFASMNRTVIGTSYLDDFTSNNGWVDNSGSYTYSGSGYLNLASNAGTISFDMQDSQAFGAGNNVSNEAFYLEFQVEINSESGADNENMYGFSDNQSNGYNTSQAWAGVSTLIGYAPSPGANGIFVESTASGNVPVAGQGTLAGYQQAVGNYYRYKIRRVSATVMTAEIWNDNKSSLLGTSGNHTILSSEGNDLRYCKCLTYDGSASNYVYRVHDLIIYNNVSEIP